MGMVTFIYGVIEEYNLCQLSDKDVYTHNERIINSLSLLDSWPPLSREMFSITKNHPSEQGPNLEYCGRMIHFGACLKSVEYDWPEWKQKFESLLKQLQWSQAYVHFKTEYTGVISFSWRIDLKKMDLFAKEILPIKEECWEFEDLNDWES